MDRAKSVLLIEHDALWSQGVAGLLASAGYSVERTSSFARPGPALEGRAAVVLGAVEDAADLREACRAVRAGAPGAVSVLSRAAAELDEAVDEVDGAVPREAGPAFLGRSLIRLLQTREAERAAAWDRVFLQLLPTLGACRHPQEAATRGCELLTRLPGVRAARLALAPGLGGAVCERGDFGGAGREASTDLAAPPSSSLGRVTVRLTADAPAGTDALDRLGGVLASALAATSAFASLAERRGSLEQEVLQQEARRSRLAAHVDRLHDAWDPLMTLLRHDMRTPLAVILGHCELLERGPLQMAHRARGMETIRGQARRIEQQAQEGAEIAGRAVMRPVQPVGADLARLVRDVARVERPAALRREQHLQVGAAPALPLAVDLQVARQIVVALLERALAAAPDKATVRLDLAIDDGQARLDLVYGGPRDPLPDVASVARTAEGVGGALSIHPGGGGLTLLLPRSVAAPPPRGVLVLTPQGDARKAEWAELGATWEVVYASLETPRPALDAPVGGADTGGDATPQPKSPPSPSLAAVLLDFGVDHPAALERLVELNASRRAGGPAVVAVAAGDAAERAAWLGGAAEVVREPADVSAVLSALARAAGQRNAPPIDPLTGLSLLATAEARLRPRLAAARAAGAKVLAVFVELPDLDELTRDHGWEQRDTVLAWVADQVRRRAAPGDETCRAATDLFVWLPTGMDEEGVNEIAGELRAYFGKARPRLGLIRIAVQARVTTADVATGGGIVDSVGKLVGSSREGIDGA